MLTFQELICGAPFHTATIISGWEEKENSFLNVVTNIHSIEKQAIIILHASQEVIIQLPDILHQSFVQGILLYHQDEIYVPSQIREKVEQIKKPILFLKTADPDSLVRTINEMMQLKQMGLFHYVWEQLKTYWQQIATNYSIDRLLARVRELITNQVILLDPFFYVHPTMENQYKSNEFSFLKQNYLLKRTKNHEGYILIEENQEYFYIFRIENYGFLLIKSESGTISEITLNQIMQVLPGLLTWFRKEEAVMETNRKYKNQFLHDVLYNNFESEELLITQGKFWGWDFTRTVQLMVMQLKPVEEKFVGLELLESIKHQVETFFQAQSISCIVTNFHEQVLIFVFSDMEYSSKKKKEYIKVLAQQIQQMVSSRFEEIESAIGIGRLYPSNRELYRSFQEAKIALEMGKYLDQRKRVFIFEEIGVIRLLCLINNETLLTFYKENVGELLEYDREHDGELFHTLKIFFQENGDITHTADALFIHPNTLRNRLKKIESLLNINLNSYEDLLNMYVTLKISQILN